MSSRTSVPFPGLISAMVALLAVPCVAQPYFQRTYGGPLEEKAFSIKQLSDDGYIIAGQTLSFGAGGYDIWLVRTDSDGDTLWTRTCGGDQDDRGAALAVIPGGFLLLGTTASFGAESTDIWLVRTNASGDTQWTRRYGGPGGEDYGSVAGLANGDIVFCGSTRSYGAGGSDAWVVRTDSVGNELWARTYGGTQDDGAFGLTPTSDSGFLVSGYTTSFGAGQRDAWVLKLNAAGDTQWTRTCGGPGPDFAGCAVEKAGGYVVGGSTASFGAGGWDMYAIGITAAGDTQWTRTYGGQYDDYVCAGCATADTDIAFAGYTCPTGQDHDVVIQKVSPGGDSLWIRRFGSPGLDEARACVLTRDHGFALAGCTNSFGARGYDFYVVKTDSTASIGVAEAQATPGPRSRVMLACRPNPAAGRAAISYSVESGRVAGLAVYDLGGRRVRTLAAAGASGEVQWNGLDDRGRAVPDGTYVCCLLTGEGAAATAPLRLVR